MKVLMVASENDVFPGGKVGGIGDVIRDIPTALAEAGLQVDVVIPGYGAFSKLANAEYKQTVNVQFRGRPHAVTAYQVQFANVHDNINHWVLEHTDFAVGGEGQIYCNDADGRPFAADANKFALFSAAVAKSVVEGVFGQIDMLHLHDWHSAMIAVLRAYDAEYQDLQQIQTVYTIHNLALQGIRPVADDESSLMAWFPQLRFDAQQINDPRYPHCFNPMRAGINLADKVHAVSPNYAVEILQASDPERAFIGGEGLEADLANAASEQRLHGILNGCEYPDVHRDALPWQELLLLCKKQLMTWLAKGPLHDRAHLIALTRITQLLEQTPKVAPLVITSVGRITDQKVQLLQQASASGDIGLARLLTVLNSQGLFILLGSGDAKLEQFLADIAAKYNNFIFIKGYSEALSDSMYNSGDLFLMPSSFEPCGISQMLSMRAGQPCLAHSVGGLADTIQHEHNGFLFNGKTPEQQVENMLSAFQSCLTMRQQNTEQWSTIANNAAAARFLWDDAAVSYIDNLYS